MASKTIPVISGDAVRLTPIQWVICAVACFGFAFDLYELLMLPLIVRDALMEMIGARPGSPEFNHWVALLFYVPAVAGGILVAGAAGSAKGLASSVAAVSPDLLPHPPRIKGITSQAALIPAIDFIAYSSSDGLHPPCFSWYR